MVRMVIGRGKNCCCATMEEWVIDSTHNSVGIVLILVLILIVTPLSDDPCLMSRPFSSV